MIAPVLAVDDVDVSLAFYTEKLGFKQDMVLPGSDGVNAFAGISLGQASFMLSRNAVENRGKGVVFMVYLADDIDIDTVYSDILSKGVAMEQEITTEYWGDRVFTVVDPDGYYVALAKTVEQADMEHVEKVMRGEVERE